MASPNINVLMSLQDKFTPKLKAISKQTGIATNQLKKADQGIRGIASGLGGIAVGIGTAMAGAVAGITGFAVHVGADFEEGMSKVQAISGASGEALTQLTEKAKELGAKTSLSATQVSEAMKYMAMAGWDSSAINNGVEGLVRLAEASGEELGSVSDIVTDAMTAFQMSSNEVGRFGDVLSATATNANTNVGMMGESFKECAALCGTMGYSIEDISLAIGTMANAGIKGSSAGTALKNTISNMSAPTKAQAEVMQKLGLSLTDSSGKMKDFRTVMIEMRKAFAGLSKEEQAGAAAELFGKESMAGMLSIINASEGDFNKLAMAIDNSKGSTEKMAIAMNNNLNGAIKSFKSKMEALGIAIYDKFKGPLTQALTSINDKFGAFVDSIDKGDLSGTFEKLGESIGQMAVGLADFAIAALPAITSLFGFVVEHGDAITSVLSGIAAGFVAFKAISTVMSLVSAFGVALEGVTTAAALFNAVCAMNPIGLVVIAVAALVAALVMLWQNWDVVQNEIDYVWNQLNAFCEWVTSGFSSAWQGFCDSVYSVFFAMVEGFQECIATWQGILYGIIDFISSVFAGDWSAAWDNIVNIFGTIIDGIKARAMGPLNWISDKVSSIAGSIGSLSFGGDGGSGGETHNATGTSYFGGGSTYVNENNRGELITLPSGSQIIPHDLAKQAVGGSQNITINLTVQGNVIGNEDFYNECGRAITARLGMALANM